MNTNSPSDELRSEVLALLAQSAARFTDMVQSLAAPEWEAAPRDGEWSLAQVAEHIALVEVSSGKVIARKLFQEPAGPELLAEAEGKEAILRRLLPDRIGRRVEAPDFVQPTGTWKTRDELLSAFWLWRGSTIALLSDPARDPSRYVFRHPIWGAIDGRNWGLFLALHLDRHLEQMVEVLKGAKA